jgi:uridylate kinase
MLGTSMNALILKEVLGKKGAQALAMGALAIEGVLTRYEPISARGYISQGRVLVLGGGTGNPIFTTDTCAVLRARELEMDAVFKATKVDYVYDKDPVTYPDARAFKEISYQEALERRLGVMDLTAMALAMESQIPIRVFNFSRPGNLLKAMEGSDIGTLIWR